MFVICEAVNHAPKIISRVPEQTMYTLTPEDFLIPSFKGVPEALDRTRIISDQTCMMLELYNSIQKRSHYVPKPDDNQIIFYKRNPKPEPIEFKFKVLSSRVFPIERRGLACLLPSSSSSSSEIINIETSSEIINVETSSEIVNVSTSRILERSLRAFLSPRFMKNKCAYCKRVSSVQFYSN